MRILDVITENQTPLSGLLTTTGATQPINAQNARPNQVTWIKQQLSRHRLVTGLRNNQFVLGNRAWAAPIDPQWTPQLDAAIVAWKTSVNIQVSGNANGPLEASPTAPGIVRQDLQYLETTELSNTGLIVAGRSGQAARAFINSKGLLDGQTYQPGSIPYGIEYAKDTYTLVTAVGFSAWYRIAAEILQSNNKDWAEGLSAKAQGQRTVAQMEEAFYRDLTATSAGWLTNLGRANTRGKNATYADGSTQPFIMLKNMPSFPEIYKYYTDMAKRLWEKDQRNSQDARQVAGAAAASPATATTLDESSLRAMSAQLTRAFKNNLLAILPGGRSFFNDEEAIQSTLGRLRTAADFDNLSRVYSEINNGEVLHERLYEELSKDAYTSIVIPRLLAIRRIAPRLIHANINFGEADTVSVKYEGTTYKIQKELGPVGQPAIQGYDRTRNYDEIVIDNILKLGVETSDGRLPDFDQPPSQEAVVQAQLAFINNIQITYPEMVSFYVRAEPFDKAVADIGGLRLRGIVNDAARMDNNRDVMANYIVQEIADDRDWLIGTEDTDPAADIEFDDRYHSEGLSNREFPVVSADDDVSLNANEEEILESLRSTQENVVLQAVDTLLQSNNPEQMWENIYRKAAAGGIWLEDLANIGNGQEDVQEFLDGTDSGTPIVRVIRELGLPLAAPKASAEMFYNAGRGKTFGTNEETIDALIAQIKNRYDYELIDERYRQPPISADNSLIDDLASEQFQGIWGGGFYASLATIIGDSNRLELIRAKLSSRMMNALQDVERSPTRDTIESLRTAIRREELTQEQISLVAERLQATVENTDESPARILLINLINELPEDTRFKDALAGRPRIDNN